MNENSVNSTGKRHQSQSSQNAYSKRTKVDGYPASDNASNGFNGMSSETGPEPMVIDHPMGDVTHDMAEVIIEVDISKTTDKSSKHKKKHKDTTLEALRYALALRNSCGGVIKLKHAQRTREEVKAWRKKFFQKLDGKLKNAGERNPHTDLPFKEFGEMSLMFVAKSANIPLTVEDSNLLIRVGDNSQKVQDYDGIKSKFKSRRVTCKCHHCDKSPKKWQCLQKDSILKELSESRYVEFKEYETFDDFSGLEVKIRDNVTAFSNTSGGTLYIGVQDNGKVLGLIEQDKVSLKRDIQQCISKTICIPFSNKEEVRSANNYHIRFIPVEGDEAKRVVIAIDICRVVDGVVFRAEPKCPTINENGEVVDMSLEEFREHLKEPESDPKCKVEKYGITVYKKLSETMDSILEQPGYRRQVVIHPENAKDWIKSDEFNKLLDIVQPSMTSGGHMLVQKSWNALLGKEYSQPPSSLICDVLLCSPEHPLVLVTLVHHHAAQNQNVVAYNKTLARTLKRVLTEEGGCVNECVVKPVVISTKDDPGYITCNVFSLPDCYPDDYDSLIRDNYTNVRKSLALLLTRIKPLSNVSSNACLKHFLVLTEKQYKLLERPFKMASKVGITGLPGTGKTVLAIERIRRLRNSGVQSNKVLYVCSNKCLEARVKSLELCPNGNPLCTVINYLKLANNPQMVRYYKHVIADEVHNYEAYPSDVKSEGWPWWEIVLGYDHCTYWMFLDESQRISKAIPVKIKRREFVSYNLDTIVRTTKKIFNFYKHFVKEDTSDVEFGHDMDGTEPTILVAETGVFDFTKKRKLLENILVSTLYELIVKEGLSPSDITVLFSTKDAMEFWMDVFQKRAKNCPIRNGEEPREPGVIFESIRRYSGEQNSTVIGFCPGYVDYDGYQDNSALMVSLCSRPMLHLILVFDCEFTARHFLSACEGFDDSEIDGMVSNKLHSAPSQMGDPSSSSFYYTE